MWAVYGLEVAESANGVKDGDELKEADARGLVHLGGRSPAKTPRMGDVVLIDTGDGVFARGKFHASHKSREIPKRNHCSCGRYIFNFCCSCCGNNLGGF